MKKVKKIFSDYSIFNKKKTSTHDELEKVTICLLGSHKDKLKNLKSQSSQEKDNEYQFIVKPENNQELTVICVPNLQLQSFKAPFAKALIDKADRIVIYSNSKKDFQLLSDCLNNYSRGDNKDKPIVAIIDSSNHELVDQCKKDFNLDIHKVEFNSSATREDFFSDCLKASEKTLNNSSQLRRLEEVGKGFSIN